MSNSLNKPTRVLYSPIAPSAAQQEPERRENVKPTDAEYATSSWHQEGFFLADAEFEGWRFGLLQEFLHASGVQAFVRSPLGVEATLVSDSHAKGIERLAVVAEPPEYIGAFRIQLPPPLTSRENLVSGFKSVLPLIKQQFVESDSLHAKRDTLQKPSKR